jgi:hypothetical protein
MNTLIHLSHQAALLAQMAMAAIAMLGLGLEGMSAGNGIRLEAHAESRTRKT